MHILYVRGILMVQNAFHESSSETLLTYIVLYKSPSESHWALLTLQQTPPQINLGDLKDTLSCTHFFTNTGTHIYLTISSPKYITVFNTINYTLLTTHIYIYIQMCHNYIATKAGFNQ